MRRYIIYAWLLTHVALLSLLLCYSYDNTLRLAIEPSRAAAAPKLSADDRRLALDVVLKEKEVRLAEEAGSAERLEAGVVFYLSVVVVGVFVAAFHRDFPSWVMLRKRPATPFLVLLFLFANLTMAAQAMTLALNGMANAKFVHVFVNPQLADLSNTRALAAGVARPNDTLYWDGWNADVKQLFIRVRGISSYAWIVLVAFTSIAALTLYDTRNLPFTAAAAAAIGIFVLSLFAGWLIEAALTFADLGAQFNDRVPHIPDRRILAVSLTDILTCIGFGIVHICAHVGREERSPEVARAPD